MFSLSKYICFLLRPAAFLAVFGGAYANHSSTSSDTPSAQLSEEELQALANSIVVRSGSDTAPISSTQSSKLESEMYCASNNVTGLATSQFHYDGDIERVDQSVKIVLNGEDVEFNRSFLARSEFRHFGFDIVCTRKHFIVTVTGYNDSDISNGSVVYSFKADSLTGKIEE